MKPIEEQTYDEILEVEPDASAQQIQKAYERCRETFQSDSMAIYSLFSEPEVRKIQLAIEEAYRVLLKEALRRNPEQSFIRVSVKPESSEPAGDPGKTATGKESEAKDGAAPADYRGKTLKEIREKLHIDLQGLSAQTRINPKILQSIEEETREKLPPRVYLKGFLKSYAQSLGLNPARVVETYLRFLDGEKKK